MLTPKITIKVCKMKTSVPMSEMLTCVQADCSIRCILCHYCLDMSVLRQLICRLSTRRQQHIQRKVITLAVSQTTTRTEHRMHKVVRLANYFLSNVTSTQLIGIYVMNINALLLLKIIIIITMILVLIVQRLIIIIMCFLMTTCLLVIHIRLSIYVMLKAVRVL